MFNIVSIKNSKNCIFKISCKYKIFIDNEVKESELFYESNSIPVLSTNLYDKNHKEIYLYDILKFDGIIEDYFGHKRFSNNYFIAIFDEKKCKVEFLYYDKSLHNFCYYDDFIEYNLEVVCNGVELLNNNNKKIPISKNKILSIINKTNEYFTF
jgi:hypothetical protein